MWNKPTYRGQLLTRIMRMICGKTMCGKQQISNNREYTTELIIEIIVIY